MKTLIFLLTLSLNVNAYDKVRAKNNLASDYVECAVFFTLSAQAIENTEGKSETYTTFDTAATTAFITANSLSNAETANARFSLYADDQLKQIDNDFSNLSILMTVYLDLCENLLKDPTERYQYWLAKKPKEE